ncbi:MAG: hypothetical protein Kow00108_19590 [Calditrichia bacterium]
MDISELKNVSDVKPLVIPLHEVAHLVIEPTYECNIQCEICYNTSSSGSKSMAELQHEIKLAMTKRKLDTISILGGEPTLYPHLEELISYIRSLGLHCQMLSNGIRFLETGGEEYLKSLKNAGLERILIHADEGQVDKIDVNSFGHTVFQLLEKHRIWFGLTMTVYPSNVMHLPIKIKEFSVYRFFDGILATLAKDFEEIIHKNKELHPDLNETIRYLSVLNIKPATYLPTSRNHNHISWLIYFYYINSETGESLSLSGRMIDVFRKLYRFLYGKQFFSTQLKQKWFIPMFMGIIVVQLILGPNRLSTLRSLYTLLRKSRWLRSLRFHYLVIQQGPVYDPESDDVEICYHCPDATIRNGVLTPVCLADKINPLDGQSISEDWIPVQKHVFGHLGENH